MGERVLQRELFLGLGSPNTIFDWILW